MEIVGSPSSTKPGFYGDSTSGEVSYLDLQKNSFVDLRARKHTPTQLGDFHNPTNFIRNQISQTLHMRSAERVPVPLPRRTYDSDIKNENLDQRNNMRENVYHAESPSGIHVRSPDVSLLRSHINIGGTSVRLRNPQRLSPGRKAKTMSWMEPPSRKLTAPLTAPKRHSNVPTDEKYLRMLKEMDERRRTIENERLKKLDRRDYIEKEKQLKEDLWTNELSNLQTELDAVLFDDNKPDPTISSIQSSMSVDTPRATMVSENNNNNSTPSDTNNSTYVVNSSQLDIVESPGKTHAPSTYVEEAYVKKPAVRKSLQFENGDHRKEHQVQGRSNADVWDQGRLRPGNLHAKNLDLIGTDVDRCNYDENALLKSQDGMEQPALMKLLDLPSPSNKGQKVTPTMNSLTTSKSVSSQPHDRLHTFNITNPSTSHLHDVPLVSPYRSCLEVKVTVEKPSTDDINVARVTEIGDKTAVVGLHEQENRDPNCAAVTGNTFLSTYDSFAHKIPKNSSNQSTPQKSDLTPMEESLDKNDRPTHNDSSPLMKTVERNCSHGEGYELVDNTTPNTMMAKKKELFLLKQLKKEEELKRKRAEREREEEGKKDEARIKQEEINAKREEERLKRQQILEDYKRRKMEQEESQRMRETGDIIASAKKHPKSASSKGIHNNRKGLPYASSLAGSVSNVSEAGTALNSDMDGRALSVKSAPASTKRLSTGYRLDWETESALSTAATEYNGPRLYKEPSLKSNKHIINNAICHCCLPGKVNETTRLRALQILDMSEARHFMILFRDSKCQFRALYIYDPDSEKLSKLDGSGPSTISPAMIDCLYKYNSGRKCFTSLPSKTLSVSIDAVTIKNSLWQTSKRGKIPKKKL